MHHHGTVSEEQPATQWGQGVQATGKRNARLRQTVRDMVLSMVVVLVVVAVVMLLVWRPQPDPVKVVDPAPYEMLAAGQASFPVTAPRGLSADWRPTSVRWEPTNKSQGMPVLHIGYVTPQGEYAQVTEFAFPSDADPAASVLVREQAQNVVPDTTRGVNGQVWLSGEADGTRMIARVTGGAIAVVSGTANWQELESLAGSLQPVVSDEPGQGQ